MIARRKNFKGMSGTFRSFPWLGFWLVCLLLIIAFAWSLAYGSASIDPWTAWTALFAYDGSNAHQVVIAMRLPRTLAAMLVGAGLGVAGTLLQAVTKNPLSSPSVLGISAGGSFAVVVASTVFGGLSVSASVWFALIGSGIAGLLVYILGSAGRKGMTPLKLVVAGSTIAILFTSLTQGLLTIHESTLDDVRFWITGAVAGRTFEMLWQILPFFAVALPIALLLGKQVTILALGDDVARGLGIRVGWMKGLISLLVIVSAGASVAIAGPIAFVGLVVPHVARALVGSDYRWVLSYSALLGAILMISSDIFARWVIHPGEIPVGAVTAIIGAPVLIWLVRRKVRHEA